MACLRIASGSASKRCAGGVEGGDGLAFFDARAAAGVELDAGVGIDRLAGFSRPAPVRCTAQPRAVVSISAT
jgi:hypothetical protein